MAAGWRVPNHLQEALAKKRVIPFVGAGVSMAVRNQDTGEALFPSWPHLLEQSAECLEKEGKDKYGLVVRGFLGMAPPRYLEAARYAREGLGSLWYDFLTESLDFPIDKVNLHSLELAQLLWRLGSQLIVTTNYDDVLFWACEDRDHVRKWIIQNTHGHKQALRGQLARPTIWHLHGHISEPQNLILTPDGYNRLYADQGTENSNYPAALITLRQFLVSHTFLFIGFSLDDPYLGLQIRGINEIFEGAAGPHYILMREPGLERVQAHINQHKLPLEPVTFSDFGEPLIRCVRSLVDIVPEGEADLLPKVEVQARLQETLYNPDLDISHPSPPSRETVDGVPEIFVWYLRAFNPGDVSINVGPILLSYEDEYDQVLVPDQRGEEISSLLQQREVSIYQVDNDSLRFIRKIEGSQQVEVRPRSHITLRIVILEDVHFYCLQPDSQVKLAVDIWYQVIGPSRSHKVASYESELFKYLSTSWFTMGSI
jgi:hypothetical protein